MTLLSYLNLILIINLAGQLLLTNLVVGQNDEDNGFLQALNETKVDLVYPFDESHEHSRCQPMKIPFCENVQYNETMLPNFLGQKSQQDIIHEINIYTPLMQVGCSPDLKLFLCSVYAPICFDHMNGTKPLSLFPCRSLCESARQGCISHLRQLDKDWPPALQCDKFPDKRRDKAVLCVGKEDESRYSQNSFDSNDRSESISSAITRDLGFVCPKNFEVNSYILHLNGKTYNNCAMPCDDVPLDKAGTRIVRFTTGILAIVCLISTTFTCISFLLDTKRFEYPARPIVIIAFCQLIVASAYLLGFITNNKISCNDPADPPRSLPNMRMVRTITMGNKKGSCTLQFMALYFFQMSSMFWWLMMTISWCMIANLKWAPEAVGSVARYFHLFSWTIPALLTIYLSVLGDIEGDALTGTCYVSMSNQESIGLFVMTPTIICLSAGCVFLALGFKSIWDSRETLRIEYGKQTDEHNRLVVRILLFSLFFIIFSILLIWCHYHEQANLNSWMLSWLSNICKNREYSIPCPVRDFTSYSPHYSTFILKFVATMALGIISAVFMMSEKTLTAYREVAELSNYRT